jgi:hypothetical protein
VVSSCTVNDTIVLALTAGMTWGLWRLMETWGAMGACWLWAWGMWIAREMRAL